MSVMHGAERIVADLFARICRSGQQQRASGRVGGSDARTRSAPPARLAADYLAGQTDRYALAEHRRLFAETPELR